MRRLCVVLAAIFLLGIAVPAVTEAQETPLCFDVPGITNCIEGRFRQYWQENGGLAVFGYPITAAADQQTAQGTFRVQYFERNRFELHPENARPYDVLLGRLGDDRLKQQGRDWFALPKGQQTSGCLWFAETGHSVCNQDGAIGFRSFWESHGLSFDGRRGYSARESLALFGLPLSEPVEETNAAGQRVLTQWFERARFEYHPDQPRQFRVLLGLLGNETRSGTQPPQPSPTPDTACANIAAPVNAKLTPNCVRYGRRFYLEVFGFAPNERISFWVTPENGTTIAARNTITVDANGGSAGYIYTDDFFGHQLQANNYVLVARNLDGSRIATAPFRVLP